MRKTKLVKPATEQAVKEYVAAMAELVQDSRFEKFIDALRADRENCVLELSRYEVVECERKTLNLIGAIGAYTDIIARFDEALSNIRAAKEDEAA